MLKKYLLLLSLAVFSQTNCWKEIVPKNERFPLMKLPNELIHQIVLSKIQLPEIDIELGASMSEDTLNQIFEFSSQICNIRANFINDYLKNLSKTNHFFKVHSNQILNEFDNKIIKHLLLQASKNEHFIPNSPHEETAKIYSKRFFLSPILGNIIDSCKCPKTHNSEFSIKLIESGADIRDLIRHNSANIFA